MNAQVLGLMLNMDQPYGDFIMNYTPNYVQRRPANLPAHLSWPSQDAIVEGLAEVSRLNFP